MSFIANPGNFYDGERVPCFGGPRDGTTARVEVLFGLPCAVLTVAGAIYLLDHTRRAWVHKPMPAAAPDAGREKTE